MEGKGEREGGEMGVGHDLCETGTRSPMEWSGRPGQRLMEG